MIRFLLKLTSIIHDQSSTAAAPAATALFNVQHDPSIANEERLGSSPQGAGISLRVDNHAALHALKPGAFYLATIEESAGPRAAAVNVNQEADARRANDTGKVGYDRDRDYPNQRPSGPLLAGVTQASRDAAVAPWDARQTERRPTDLKPGNVSEDRWPGDGGPAG